MNIFNHDFDIKALGILARIIRIKAGLSQSEAAKLIGSSQPNVSAAEKGKNSRYASVAINIIEIIGDKKVIGPFYRIEKRSDD